MKNWLFILLLLFTSCETQNEVELQEFDFIGEEEPSVSEEGTFLVASYEKSRLSNGDWYRAKVYLINNDFPAGYSDSTMIKFLPDSASYEKVLSRGMEAVVRNDTGYVKFKALQPNMEKGDSILKLWTGIIVNPALPVDELYIANYEYVIYKE